MSLKLAISGKMRSGKDTAVDYLIGINGGTSVHIFEAGYRFVEALLFYWVIGHRIDKNNKNRLERLLLQWVGSFGRKYFGKDVWLRQTLKLISKLPGNVFVTGVRFPNEIEKLKELGFTSLHIVRDDDLRSGNDASAVNLGHETETGLDAYTGFYYVIRNNGTLSDFKMSLDYFNFPVVNRALDDIAKNIITVEELYEKHINSREYVSEETFGMCVPPSYNEEEVTKAFADIEAKRERKRERDKASRARRKVAKEYHKTYQLKPKTSKKKKKSSKKKTK